MPTVAVTVQINSIGTDAGPFTISDNVLGNLATGVTRLQLLGGFIVSADDTATTITVTSDAPCSTVLAIPIVSSPCGGPTPPPSPTPPPPPPTPTPTPPPPPPPGSSSWIVRNADCGFGTINDVGINGSFMNSLEGPSNFPLTSTLYGVKTSPNGVIYGGTNTIQLNVTTNLPGSGNCGAIFVYINGVVAYDTYFTSTPFPSISGVLIQPGDSVEVQVACYIGPCP